ncbi:uncharacterized protein LOC122507303 [Leptopilina heterotoma]|uniref:uncharacterized protein LOC122507303 n=1 Tax=Leptopilina heterotoma TaxID=63436 RepID=UPI001CA8428D|nr:uncharacterized protein LOC122507303 [Leptopilina heterotoma]XP_043475861.1 uncharacterized protein LOC122507303 [Leptopilina heterotoma]
MGRQLHQMQINIIQTSVTDIDVDNSQVLKYAPLGLEKYAANKSYEPIIGKINRATGQTVVKEIYKINVTFGETNCAKGQKTNCALKPNAESENCTIEVLLYLCNDGDDEDSKVTVTCP